MRKKLLVTLSALTLAATMSAGLFTLTACGNKDNDKDNDQQEQQQLTDKELEGEVLADWSEGKAEAVFESDGWSNKSVFNTQWSANNVSYENGEMKLTITDNPNGSVETNDEYFGGEARTYQYFGYGDYEVCMKPAKKEGTASTFFTCTGNYDTNPNTGEPNPWDEIDIEFLGSDTTEVQFNYYVNGVGGHEYMYDLGFDASEEFHEYGFRWTKDYIVWFVDNEPVYKVEATADSAMPAAAGRILMNYWCGTEAAEGWMGEYSNPGTEGAEYKWVRTSAQAEWGEIPEEVEVEEFEGDWTATEALPIELVASANDTQTDYTIAAGSDGKSASVTWTKAGAYNNVNYAIGAEDAADKNWLHMTLKNNSDTQTTNARINVRSVSGDLTTTTNSYGFGNGELLRTNVGEGTFIDLAPGEEVEIEIKYYGVISSVEIMLDSLQSGVVEKSGNITISDVKLAKQGEVIIPDAPESNNQGININGTNHEIEGDLGGTFYIINTSEDGNSIDVTYSAIPGATYKNVNIKDIKTVAGDKTTLKFTVKNNGTENVTMRVDVIGEKVVNVTNNHYVCNTSATIDGEAAATDLAWGGSTFTLAAGETYEIEVVYDAKYVPASLQIMLDSSVYNDTATHSGDVTISDITFSGEYVPEEGEEEGGDEQTPVTPPAGDSVNLTFNSTDKYTVDKSGTASSSINVTYTAVVGDSYANISAADAATLAAGNDTFSVTIKNNGTTSAKVRVDVIGTNKVTTEGTTTTDVCNLSHTVIGGTDAGYTDRTYGGTTLTVAAGEEITLVITYDGDGDWGAVNRVQLYFDSATYGDSETHSGNFTVSNFKFTSEEGGDEQTPVTPPAGDTEDTDKPGVPHESVEGVPDRLTAAEDIIVDFTKSGDQGFWSANGYKNGDPFNCTWSNSCTVVEDGIMNMSVKKEGNTYYGAEYRSHAYYSYGYYSVCMKAADCSGVISSFFTYTNNPWWDEIDIEILGKNMTEVQFNYYTKGEGNHEYLYKLGFDASEDFHEYGFDWQPDSITWYVDGKAVYRATENIPTADSQIMMNVWNCKDHDEWSGAFDESALPATAQYKWVAFKAYSGESTGIDLDTVTVGGNLVGGTDPAYTATANDDNTLDISYTDIAGNSYKVVELQGIATSLQANNVFTATVTNNGTETVNLRVNLTANKVGNNDSCNVSATQDGTAVRTDTEWGGSFFTIEAGATITVQVVYDNTRTLLAVQFMVDSSVGDATLRSGDITISDMALAVSE